MLDYMKPVGAFLEHTIRPLIAESKWFLDELEKKGIKVNETNIKHSLDYLSSCYIRYAVIQLVQNIIIAGIVCLTIYHILV
jgi:hypothetical protein